MNLNEPFSDRIDGVISLSVQLPCSNESEHLFKKNRERQKLVIKQGAACDIMGLDSKTELEGDVAKLYTLLIRLFNLECDVLCSQIKDLDVHVLGELIEKSFYQLNELSDFRTFKFRITISFEYFNLKLDELLILYNGVNPDKKIECLVDL